MLSFLVLECILLVGDVINFLIVDSEVYRAIWNEQCKTFIGNYMYIYGCIYGG
jgi:hypothetical protein